MFKRLLVVACGLLPACAGAAEEVTVAVAANAVAPVQELAQQFERQHRVHITLSSGATGLLAQQLRQGAPFDVFVSADTSTVLHLAADGFLTSSTVKAYATGQLILWVGDSWRGQIRSVQDLSTASATLRVALPSPGSAPYGAAARQVLQHLGQWERLQPAMVIGENVNNTFQLARSGNVDACFVSYSVALQYKAGVVHVPQELYTPIRQSLSVTGHAKHPQTAQEFADFMTSIAAHEVWRKHGYTPL
jgi:molybdate transport system substrate-binding protein